MAGFQFVKVTSSNYFCSQGKLNGSEAATLFIPRRYRALKMSTLRQFIFILIISLTSSICYSQTNIWGLYVNHYMSYSQIDLRPDFSYNYYSQAPCGFVPAFRDTGIFTIIADTIYLKSHDTSFKSEKYLFISHLSEDKNNFWFWDTGTLVRIFKSDSILPTNQAGRLSDYESLLFGSYVRQLGYYNDTKLMFKTEYFDKTKIITNYYPSGQVESIKKYFKDRKSGNWYFYKENGQIYKIETYRRNKLKRLKKNAL